LPLARARCTACTLPLGDPPYVPVVARCVRCGLQGQVGLAADGTPGEFDAAFPPAKLLQWFGAARIAMANGTPGTAIGACMTCSTPLLLPSRDPLALPCPHCGEPVKGAVGDVVVDQWPEPWTKVEASGMELEYRLGVLDDVTGITAGCAVCGLPTPPSDPAMRCKRCNAVVWVERPSPQGPGERPRRVQLGVRVNGTRGGRPFNVIVPIAQGEAMLRTDAAIGSSDRSGGTWLGVTGVGCAVVAASFFVLVFVVAMLVRHC